MCDAERDWERVKKKTKMAAHGGETEDPGELEDLQMILSLADDADEEFMEDLMLKEAEPFEVKEVTSVLQRLSSSCEERESRFAFEILSKIDIDSAAVDRLGTFVRELNDVVLICYKSVDKVKSQQLKMVTLEKAFTRHRFDRHSKLFEAWQHLVGVPPSNDKESNVVFQHILQHIWSYAILRRSNSKPVSVDHVESQKDKVPDEVERVAIRQHAGWAIKRARDTILSSPTTISIKLSCNDSTHVVVSKEYLLKLIDRLGKDELQEPGKFMFMPFSQTDDFFITLHKETEVLLKQESILKQTGKDAVIWALKQLSTSAILRSKWESLLGKASGYAKAAHVILLQRIVTMFLKSKQQIIREQLQLKPQKSSQSLRQSLPKSTKNTATSKTITEGGENASKALNAIPGIVTELRKNAKNPEKVEQFLASLKEGNASSILHFLTGKELVRILKSLDLPCFSGKGKAKQIDTLNKFLSSVEVVSIKYPEKVCIIFFISQ